ncbi:MAG: ATP-binding protein [Bacteroidota bacterium]
MRKPIVFFAFLLLLHHSVSSQLIAGRDSLLALLKTLPNDTNRVLTLNRVAFQYQLKRPDSTYLLGQQAYELSRSLNYIRGQATSLMVMGIACTNIGDDAKAIKMYNQSKELSARMNNPQGVSIALSNLADMYMQQGEWQKGLDKMKESNAIYSTLPVANQASKSTVLSNIGECFFNLGQLDSATTYLNEALALERLNPRGIITTILYTLGDVAIAKNNTADAYAYYKESIAESIKQESFSDLYQAYYRIAYLFNKNNQQDSALHYAKKALQFAEESDYLRGILKGSEYLSSLYEGKDDAEALRYFKIANTARDSLYSQNKVRQLVSLNFEEKEKAQQIESSKTEYRNAIKLYSLIGVLVIFGVIALFLVRNNRQKQRANQLLQQQKDEIDAKAKELLLQKENLEQSYKNVELLGEIGRKITASLSVEAIIGTAYDKVNSLMEASVFGIGIYHDENKSIDFPATYENGKALVPYSNSIYDENRLAGICFNSGKEVVIGNLQAEYKTYLQKVPAPNQGNQAVSLIYLPLKANEKVLGVITVQSFRPNAFSDYDLYMLRNIAIYAAIAIENAESFNKLGLTIEHLKSTQAKLVQSEKMASLGELTAGIAHEIQNPLNFVNNFSDLSKELLDEMNEELVKGDLNEVKNIVADIRQNLEKINHHGRRADAIVKGMLQHSRTSSGQKETININALADEYLRLAFHGLRAKDKSFNATLKTDFDKSLVNINIIPQDIGRVILNLINNAFYTVDEKKKLSGDNYEPTVSVSTMAVNGSAVIRIADNGYGIPPKIVEKIFQPFFTTKPTGKGTGLGLSLSYDIVKAHGGELKVDSREGEGSEFTIILPTN